MNIDIVAEHKDLIPFQGSLHSAGYDLKSSKDYVLKPQSIKLIDTGIKISIPTGYEIQIRSRSGLSLKGVFVINSPGTIDADYRGEIKVALCNFGTEDFQIKPGDRIAQMVLNKIETINFIVKNTLDSTNRGDFGFGSTGI